MIKLDDIPGTELVCTLPNNEKALAMAYDKAGRLVICSTGGVYIYDGKELKKIDAGAVDIINNGDCEYWELNHDLH